MVGAAACWPVQSKRGMIAHARTAWQAPASTLGQARPPIGTSGGKGPGLLARPGANGANVAKPYKGPECSNGYGQRGRCDSRPDWHKLTVLISSPGHHDPHSRGSAITFRIGRAGHHDPYRHRVTVPDWHKYACTAVRLCCYAAMSICGYAHMGILRMSFIIIPSSAFALLCGYAHTVIRSGPVPIFYYTNSADPDFLLYKASRF